MVHRRFLLMMLCATAWAKEVTVDGTGIDRESALRDARRLAVEETIGVFVDSRTLVENMMVAMDNTYTKSAGFVGKVEVLEEGLLGGAYHVKARIEVNQNPDPALLQQVQAVLALNDPRIAVIVTRDGQPGVHEEKIETAIMDGLILRHFTHVVDPKIVAALQDARLLESLYDGVAASGVGTNYGADFVVLGKCATTSEPVVIPDFKGGYKTTSMQSGKSEMNVKIVRLDTGDILETFSLETSGIEFGNSRAEHEAVKAMAEQAAAKVDEKFRRIGARTSGNVQITVAAQDYSMIVALAEELRGIPGVQNVVVREHSQGRAIVDVDTMQTVGAVVKMLKDCSRFGIFVDSISGSSAKLMIS